MIIIHWIIIALAFSEYTSATPFQNEILQVSIITRHGQRTPEYLFPKDPYKSPIYWPEGAMQLTREGSKQLKILGEILRKRYTLTFPLKYEDTEAYITSTGTNRTIYSAAALASGLYPNQSVPIIVTPMQCGHMLNLDSNCPAYDEEFAKITNFPEVMEEEKKHLALYRWLSPRVGRQVTSLRHVSSLYTNLLIEKQRGLELPAWTNDVFVEPLKSLTGLYLEKYAYTTTAQRLRFGPLILDILSRASTAGIGRYSRLNVYSAHDITLVGVMKALAIYENVPPEFAAALIFEVHKNGTSQEREIRIFYRKDNISELTNIEVPQCGVPCTLNKLWGILSPVLPIDITEECKTNKSRSDNIPVVPNDDNAGKPTIYFIVICTMTLFITGLLIVWTMKLITCHSFNYRRQQYVRINGTNTSSNNPRQ